MIADHPHDDQTVRVMGDGCSLLIDPYQFSIGDLWMRGWSLIPLRYRDKRPALVSWAAYQRRAATYAELEQWFGGTTRFNVGVVTGAVSGIYVIDCDSPEAVQWATERLPCDLRVRTAKGVHLYFPYSGDRPMRNKVRVRFGGRPLDLDIRSEGGYVVGPGSTHPSGHVYTREGAGWEWS